MGRVRLLLVGRTWVGLKGSVVFLSSMSCPRISDEHVADDSFTPSWIQQMLRAFAYGTQFTVSFLVYVLFSLLPFFPSFPSIPIYGFAQ